MKGWRLQQACGTHPVLRAMRTEDEKPVAKEEQKQKKKLKYEGQLGTVTTVVKPLSLSNRGGEEEDSASDDDSSEASNSD